MDDYNSVSQAPMKLVMFLDAIEHVSRICRVIRLPLGNALLLGVGGSGRQSLTRLATYMEDFHLFQVSKWVFFGGKVFAFLDSIRFKVLLGFAKACAGPIKPLVCESGTTWVNLQHGFGSCSCLLHHLVG